MTDLLDSRALGRTDCYGQRFMKPGSYPYNIVPARGAALSTLRPFVITVKERDPDAPKMTQHSISVTHADGRFRAPKETVIAAGDLVLWNCPQGGLLPFAAIGDHAFFSSARLKNESGYTHAFGKAGSYAWADAYGSKAQGKVIVHDPVCRTDADLAAWQKAMAKGTVVMINDGKPEPAVVEIQTGQTVFFMVVNGPGISITDTRLLDQGKEDRPPQRKSA